MAPRYSGSNRFTNGGDSISFKVRPRVIPNGYTVNRSQFLVDSDKSKVFIQETKPDREFGVQGFEFRHLVLERNLRMLDFGRLPAHAVVQFRIGVAEEELG